MNMLTKSTDSATATGSHVLNGCRPMASLTCVGSTFKAYRSTRRLRGTGLVHLPRARRRRAPACRRHQRPGRPGRPDRRFAGATALDGSPRRQGQDSHSTSPSPPTTTAHWRSCHRHRAPRRARTGTFGRTRFAASFRSAPDTARTGYQRLRLHPRQRRPAGHRGAANVDMVVAARRQVFQHHSNQYADRARQVQADAEDRPGQVRHVSTSVRTVRRASPRGVRHVSPDPPGSTRRNGPHALDPASVRRASPSSTTGRHHCAFEHARTLPSQGTSVARPVPRAQPPISKGANSSGHVPIPAWPAASSPSSTAPTPRRSRTSTAPTARLLPRLSTHSLAGIGASQRRQAHGIVDSRFWTHLIASATESRPITLLLLGHTRHSRLRAQGAGSATRQRGRRRHGSSLLVEQQDLPRPGGRRD